VTAISPFASNNYLSAADFRQQDQLSDVSPGRMASTDEVALSSALDDIDRSLNTPRTLDQANDAGPHSPDELRSNINDLIAGEVKSGKLTGDQAANLQSLFNDAFESSPADLPSSNDQFGDAISSTESDASMVLQDFLKMAIDAQGSPSRYNSAGSSGATSSPAARLLNYTV
jgi:hypothetical protein